MDTFVELFQGLSIVLLISILFGILAFVRIYFLATPGLQRISKFERRQVKVKPSFPFNDIHNNLISEDRRKLKNRRTASHVVVESYTTHLS